MSPGIFKLFKPHLLQNPHLIINFNVVQQWTTNCSTEFSFIGDNLDHQVPCEILYNLHMILSAFKSIGTYISSTLSSGKIHSCAIVFPGTLLFLILFF